MKMMPVRRILQLGDPTLRKPSSPLAGPQDAAPILGDLRDTLRDFQRTHGSGRGISAVQIGELKRLLYIEFQGTDYCLLNPEVLHRSAEQFELWDDCFSFPNLLVRVRRFVTVEIRYLNEHGAACSLTARGALSELLQHELDHLDGVLAIDRAIDGNSFCTREEYERRYRS